MGTSLGAYKLNQVKNIFKIYSSWIPNHLCPRYNCLTDKKDLELYHIYQRTNNSSCCVV